MGRVVPRVLQALSAPSALLSQPPGLHWLSSIILEDSRAFDIHLCAHRQAFCSAVMRQSLSVNPQSPVLSPGPSELRGDQTLAENEYQQWRKSMGLASTQKTNLGGSNVMVRSSTISKFEDLYTALKRISVDQFFYWLSKDLDQSIHEFPSRSKTPCLDHISRSERMVR